MHNKNAKSTDTQRVHGKFNIEFDLGKIVDNI